MKHKFPDKLVMYGTEEISFIDWNQWQSEIECIISQNSSIQNCGQVEQFLNVMFLNFIQEHNGYGIYKSHNLDEDEPFHIFELRLGGFYCSTFKQTLQDCIDWIDS